MLVSAWRSGTGTIPAASALFHAHSLLALTNAAKACLHALLAWPHIMEHAARAGATANAVTLPHSHSSPLVLLSIAIAILASYAALDLAGRTSASEGRMRLIWMGAGAFALGLGIWSMHYVGMLAFTLPVRVLYDLPTVLLSLLAAVLPSAVALLFVSRAQMSNRSVVASSVIMGSGIAAMHYIGMAAMRLPAICRYDLRIVAASILIAVVVSAAALLITFRLRTADGELSGAKIVLVNLFGNAWKFTANQPEARIAFESRRVAAETVFAVSDNGAGFDMAYAAKLFLPFHRLHRDSEFEGTGIGLATVHRLISRHGGRIWADSAPGNGATFFFTLGASS